MLDLDVPFADGLPFTADGVQRRHDDRLPGGKQPVLVDGRVQQFVHGLRVQPDGRPGQPAALPSCPADRERSGGVGGGSGGGGRRSGGAGGRRPAAAHRLVRPGRGVPGGGGQGRAGGLGRGHSRVRQAAHALQQPNVGRRPPPVPAALAGGRADPVTAVPRAQGRRRHPQQPGHRPGGQAPSAVPRVSVPTASSIPPTIRRRNDACCPARRRPVAWRSQVARRSAGRRAHRWRSGEDGRT